MVSAGRYYLYYCIKFQDSINVAVCDEPAGEYEFYGRVHYPDGRVMADNQPYDPSVICTEEGNFLYFGFAPCIINIPRYRGQDLRGGSVIVSNGDVGYKGRLEEEKLMSVGNDHGGLVKVKDQWYIFYHRHTYINQYNRQGCAERVFFDEKGNIPQVTITTSGMNPKPLSGDASYPAVYCCNLTNGHMGALSSIGRSNQEADFPYMTCEDGERFITNIKDGCMVGYKYINLSETHQIEVVYRADADGEIEIYTEPGGEKKRESRLREAPGGNAPGRLSRLIRKKNCI